MTLQQLKKDQTYKKHHSSRYKGYVSRKTGETQPAAYKGKYGKGYITFSPAWDSSTYCWINYYIKVTQ